MKSHPLILSFALLLSAGAACAAEAPCPTYEAIVSLDAARAGDFLSLLRTINSMPLDGRVQYHSGDLASVTVSVPDYFGAAHHLRAFDVATKLAELRDADPARFGIRTIQATVCYSPGAASPTPAAPEADPTNVGTIGHGK